jgi:DNA primase
MAKTYIDIVKYMVEAQFEVSGMVDKPDIIGAIFGQTEGLLGGDLDLRELQKSGKIGRIEIESTTGGNKTVGKLLLPSSLGRVETCILGAAIESVDRVGPFDTRFKVAKIEDTRSEKRGKIINRAKDLLKTLLSTEIPDSRELSEIVEADVKLSTVITYGNDHLPAGPDLDISDEIILVEGRADVINLLRNDIANCISVGGAAGSVPKTVVDLCKTKDVILFLDGDRGGDMILRTVLAAAEIDYIARAPDGKEVEELTRKEITKALRSKIPIDQFTQARRQQTKDRDANERHFENTQQQPQRQQSQPQQVFQREREQREREPAVQQQPREREPQVRERERERPPVQRMPESGAISPTEIVNRMSGRGSHEYTRPISAADLKEMDDSGDIESIPMIQNKPQAAPPLENEQKFIGAIAELKNTLRGRLYNAAGEVIAEAPIRELIQSVESTDGINAIVFDGIITQRLIELASKSGVKGIYAVRASQITRKPSGMVLYTTEQSRL